VPLFYRFAGFVDTGDGASPEDSNHHVYLQGHTMTTARRTRPAFTFLILAVGAASFSLLQSLVNPALPIIQRDLGTTQSAVSWILIAWLLSAAVATPLLGRIGDIIGKERAIIVSLGAIVLGSIVAGLAPTIGVLIAGRVLQGLGGAVFPLAFGIIRDEFPPERMSAAIGRLSSVIAVGGGFGTVLAGPVVDVAGWRWLFWFPAIVVAITGLLSWLFIPPSPSRAGGRIDWLAAALLGGWLVALLLPVSQGSTWGWASSLTVGLFIIAVVLFAGWIIVESRTDNPVIDLQMMRLPAIWTTNLVALLLGAAMFAVYTFLPQLLQVPASSGYGLGESVSQAGLVMLPLLVTMAIAGMFTGQLGRVLTLRAQLALGTVLVAASTLSIGLFHSTTWMLALAGAVFGFGLGLSYAATPALIVAAVPPTQTGAATGMNTNIRSIGGAVGTAVMTAIVTAQPVAPGIPSEGSFVIGFLVLTAAAVAAIGVTFAVPRHRPAGVGRIAASDETAPLIATADGPGFAGIVTEDAEDTDALALASADRGPTTASVEEQPSDEKPAVSTVGTGAIATVGP